MKYRKLGRTDIEVSEIGFGAWGIGGTSNGAVSYGPTDDRESKRALKRAFELGVTFYDTADLYGYGHSEGLIGGVFKGRRGRVVIASKVGFLTQEGVQDFSPSHIRKSIEGSLKRLQSDYVDLYQLHDPTATLLERDGAMIETLDSLKREGKIRAWGISVRTPNDGLFAIRKCGAEVVQVNFNMVDQRILENGLMNLCQLEEIGLICRTPLCFGFLTGSYSGETKFDVHDHRSRWPMAQLSLWANANQLFSPRIRHEGQTDAQLALRYCLSYPAVSTIIPGMLYDEQVDENVRASHLGPLTEYERTEVEALYKSHEFFVRRIDAAQDARNSREQITSPDYQEKIHR